ncbi:MAG TPA: hypothetical protein VFX44_11495 [Solirubrobacterales bacterium]|nr:hypothetical protein [Solirubrobacterales bacterium]
MGMRRGHEVTPDEEAFFQRHPELGKSMEKLRDEESWKRMKERRLKIEMHLENSRRILDELKRSLY